MSNPILGFFCWIAGLVGLMGVFALVGGVGEGFFLLPGLYISYLYGKNYQGTGSKVRRSATQRQRRRREVELRL